MNLQLCIPYEPCIYHCPFCIARGHKHNYEFQNLYKTNKKEYFQKLIDVLEFIDGSVVLTGECEPTQNMSFLKDVIKVIRKHKKNAVIELQTRNYEYKGGLDIDVLSYSIVDSKAYLNAYKLYKEPKKINRLVILLRRDLDFLNNYNFNSFGFQQVTFKQLQLGEDFETNKWIMNNLSEVNHNIQRSDISIRYDYSCQTAKGRYFVFRSDGNLYNSWEERSIS